MDKESLEHVAQYLATPALAFAAGYLKYAKQLRDNAAKWNWGEFFLQAGMSVLAGYIAEWLFESWKSDPHLIHAAVALAGWGGAQAIEFFGKKAGTDEATG